MAKEVAPTVSDVDETAVVMQADAQELSAGRLAVETARQLQSFKAKFSTQQKVSVTIAPTYAPYLGRTVPVGINGVVIYVPADGRAYKIPYDFAAEVHRMLRRINQQIERSKNLGQYGQNKEPRIGEIAFN